MNLDCQIILRLINKKIFDSLPDSIQQPKDNNLSIYKLSLLMVTDCSNKVYDPKILEYGRSCDLQYQQSKLIYELKRRNIVIRDQKTMILIIGIVLIDFFNEHKKSFKNVEVWSSKIAIKLNQKYSNEEDEFCFLLYLMTQALCTKNIAVFCKNHCINIHALQYIIHKINKVIIYLYKEKIEWCNFFQHLKSIQQHRQFLSECFMNYSDYPIVSIIEKNYVYENKKQYKIDSTIKRWKSRIILSSMVIHGKTIFHLYIYNYHQPSIYEFKYKIFSACQDLFILYKKKLETRTKFKECVTEIQQVVSYRPSLKNMIQTLHDWEICVSCWNRFYEKN